MGRSDISEASRSGSETTETSSERENQPYIQLERDPVSSQRLFKDIFKFLSSIILEGLLFSKPLILQVKTGLSLSYVNLPNIEGVDVKYNPSQRKLSLEEFHTIILGSNQIHTLISEDMLIFL